MLKISERREQIEAHVSCLFHHGARQFLVQVTLPFIKYLKGTSPDHVRPHSGNDRECILREAEDRWDRWSPSGCLTERLTVRCEAELK